LLFFIYNKQYNIKLIEVSSFLTINERKVNKHRFHIVEKLYRVNGYLTKDALNVNGNVKFAFVIITAYSCK